VALDALTSETDEAAASGRIAIGYVTTHAARLDYPRFVARQFPISLGTVESTCKVLIAARVKGAGMRWSRDGVQAVASLRALHCSGRWDSFWQTQPQRRPPYLRALLPSAPPAPTLPQTLPAPLAYPPPVATPAAAPPEMAPGPPRRRCVTSAPSSRRARSA